MKKLKLNYTCTDPDCAQYMTKVTDARYSYIEYREWFGNYVVCHAVVDLRDYWLPTTVFVESCRLWQNVFLSSLASTTAVNRRGFQEHRIGRRAENG